MSSSNSAQTLTELDPHKSDSGNTAGRESWDVATPKRDSGNHEDLNLSLPGKPILTRDWNAITDQANQIHHVLDDHESTPRAHHRLQSYLSQPAATECLRPAASSRRTSTVSPRVNGSRSQPIIVPSRFGSIANSKPASLQSSGTRSSASNSGEDVSRKDTGRSSASSFARSLMRAAPDLRMFNQAQNANDIRTRRESARLDDHARQQTKLGYVPPLKSPPEPTATASDEEPPKHASQPDDHVKNTVVSHPVKGALKDRRKLDQKEALRLTLPMELPSLPARQRVPAAEFVNIRDLPPPRPRSPRTPWISQGPPSLSPPSSDSQLPSTGLATAPAMSITPREKVRPSPLHTDAIDLPQSPQSPQSPQIRRLKDHRYMHRPLFNRNRSSVSDTTHTKTPDSNMSSPTSPTVRPSEEVHHSERQSRRRWGGPWSSTTEPPTPESLHPETLGRRFSLSRFLNPRKHKRSSSATSPSAGPALASDEVKSYESTIPQEAFEDMPTGIQVPPNFVPPGLHRVDTPPIFDSNGEIKSNLAEFFFDITGGTHEPKRSPNAPKGEWDSDALLMPQYSDIPSMSGSSSESPLQSSHLPTPNESVRPSSGYIPGARLIPPPMPIDNAWFRVQYGYEDSSQADDKSIPAEERARFEWLVPEHLPGSPLCPLHTSYKGPSKGVCINHGKRAKREVGRRGGSDETPSAEKADALGAGIGKKRRLASLSGP